MAVFDTRRRAPRNVAPLRHQGIGYETIINGNELGYSQKGGVLVAYDDASDQILWSQLIYEIAINKWFERDVQDCHIVSIELDVSEQSLVVSNERKQRFSVRLGDRQVAALDSSHDP